MCITTYKSSFNTKKRNSYITNISVTGIRTKLILHKTGIKDNNSRENVRNFCRSVENGEIGAMKFIDVDGTEKCKIQL